MTPARRRRWLDAGAAAAGAGAVFAVWPQRLPAAPDFILTRAPGDFLVLPAARFFQTNGGRSAGAWLALLLLGGSLLFPAAALWAGRRDLFSAARPARRHGQQIALFVLGAAVLALCARWGVSSAVDIIENVWYPPESLDPLEPLLLMSAAAGFAMLLWRAVGAYWGRIFSRRRERLTLALVLVSLCCDAAGRVFYDAGQPSLARAAGFSEEPLRGRLVLVLKEADGKPAVEEHEVVLGVPDKTQFSSAALEKVKRFVSRRPTVYARPALRYLYGGYTLAMDAAGLRAALALGETRGDVLARALLLDNLAVAPPGPSLSALLSDLSDERRLRIGAAGWARLAGVAHHLGLSYKTEEFRRRAAAGPGGVPPGLFEFPDRGGALSPGRIEGRVQGAGARGAIVALYGRPTPDSPYSLGPGQLAASAMIGADGRFRFSGLSEGDYFLALAVDAPDERPPRLSVSGNRGDLRLSARRPRAEVSLRLTATR